MWNVVSDAILEFRGGESRHHCRVVVEELPQEVLLKDATSTAGHSPAMLGKVETVNDKERPGDERGQARDSAREIGLGKRVGLPQVVVDQNLQILCDFEETNARNEYDIDVKIDQP